MISLTTARKLKEAGLAWEPQQGDRFGLADRDMDDRVFVINDMAAMVETLQGFPAVMFHGTPEWALDYVFLGDVIWLPEEGHLRQRLQAALEGTPTPEFDLLYADGVYTCRLAWRGEALAFRAADAAEAYAQALLRVLAANGE
ncbi:MAG: hypothetical protein BWY52_00194 [Chloroflexi bacterium ADurb.Bin325]|nr:MAG: hypothetical protein BWY52_00194 [Chloroflexi bacterium ADurb.Bin325]